MTVYIPIGIPGSGKSTLAAEHFTPDEIVCPDEYRRILTGDMSNQRRNKEVFQIVDLVLATRDAEGLDSFLDATNLNPDRWPIMYPIKTILMDCSIREALRRNESRMRVVPDHAMSRMADVWHQNLDMSSPVTYGGVVVDYNATEFER